MHLNHMCLSTIEKIALGGSIFRTWGLTGLATRFGCAPVEVVAPLSHTGRQPSTPSPCLTVYGHTGRMQSGESGSILGRFRVDFGSILGRFWVPCHAELLLAWSVEIDESIADLQNENNLPDVREKTQLEFSNALALPGL